MRTVSGPTDRVVVVGAGLGGLACAMRLVATGRQVTVLERGSVPGGRAGRIDTDGFRFDTGPTVLTMPRLLDETFSTLGERRSDWIDLIRLDPAYRAHFPDGSTLDVRAGIYDTAAEIDRVCGQREADGFLRFARYAERLYQVEWDSFVDVNLDGVRDLLGVPLVRLAAMGGFGSLSGRVDRFLLHLGTTAGYSRIAHHNIHFGRSWRATFDDLTVRGRLMADPSLLVCNPSRTDPDLAHPTGTPSTCSRRHRTSPHRWTGRRWDPGTPTRSSRSWNSAATAACPELWRSGMS